MASRKKTSEELFKQADELKEKLKEVRRAAKREQKLEEKEKREREYRERIEAALDFYQYKDMFEEAYQVARESKDHKMNSGITVYDWMLNESGKHEQFDWHDEKI